MTDKQLVNFWIYGKAKKIDQTADGVWLDWGGNKYYLTWKQVGASFAVLGKTEADIKMFVAKQFGYKVGYEDLEKFYQEKPATAFASPELGDWFGDLLKAGTDAYGAWANIQTEEERRKAVEATAQAGWFVKTKEAETIQTVALIGAAVLVGVILLKRRKKSAN